MASSEYNKAYYQKNKERLKEAAKRYYHENKEAVARKKKAWYEANKEEYLARQRAYRQADPERIRARERRWNRERGRFFRQGLTRSEYDAMLATQGGVCAICGRECDVVGSLSVDHCHKSGVVRGLLCKRCNSGLGFFRENGTLLLKAAAYLDEHDLTKPEAA